MNKITSALVICLFITLHSHAENIDTIKIDASHINTKVLESGTHRYLVYFKLGKDSTRKLYQLWSRTISFINYEGKEAIAVTQEWEDNDTIIHTAYSVQNKKDFATLYHESWWKRTGKTSFDFINKQAKDKGISINEKKDSSSIKQQKAFETASNQYFLNWHLDLEVFPILPYKNGETFRINFYDPGFGPPKYVDYTVIDSAILNGYDNQKIDCWLLKNTTSPKNPEIFWISKKTKEVLKLEQEFGGGRARYKIKLGYSN